MQPKKLRPASRTQLLRSLTDSSSLPALIEGMEAPALKKLIDRVGLEDAGAIVALTSSTQLAEVLDDALWRSTRPGDPESLSIEEFLRWLDVWNDIGNNFAAEKLYELGEGFTAVCLSRLVSVIETSVVIVLSDDFCAAYGDYVVRAQHDDEWDAVLQAMSELWEDYPDFLLAVLGRFCYRHSITNVNDASIALHARALHADEASARERSRARDGFVVSADAGAFLASLKQASLESLTLADGYDLTTVRHFRELQAKQRERDERQRAREARLAVRDATTDEAELDALQAALEEAAITANRSQKLLTGPDERRATSALRRALAELQTTDPEAFAGRTTELAYLSNVLMVGGIHNDAPFREDLAANAIMATCSLGAEFLARLSNDAEMPGRLLQAEPGLVKAFSVGYHLICRFPNSVVRQLRAVFAMDKVRDRFDTRRWVLKEVDGLLGPTFVAAVARGDYEDAKETLRVLSIAIEPQASFNLRALIDAYPSIPLALEHPLPESGLVDERTRFMDTLDDLQRLEEYLRELPTQVHL